MFRITDDTHINNEGIASITYRGPRMDPEDPSYAKVGSLTLTLFGGKEFTFKGAEADRVHLAIHLEIPFEPG
jgi:hypothetical protein